MRRLGAAIAPPALLLLVTCSDRSASREDVGSASQPLAPTVAPLEAGFRLRPGDYNGDGLVDIVWRDHTGNRIWVWLMRGTEPFERGPEIHGPAGDGWALTGSYGDLDADGMSDLVWHNPTTNRMVVWLMRGTEPLARGPEIPGPPGDGWICVPAGDFNRDGMTDVLWHNPTTNRMVVWLMRGTEPFARGPEIPGPPDRGWFALAAVDFDRDDMADVLWYDPKATRVAVWLMAGTAVRERGPSLPGPAGPDWLLTTVGDFNRDGMTDLLWSNTRTPAMTISLFAGTEILEQGPVIAGPPGDGWLVDSSPDSNGDGIWDVAWLNASPLRMRVWLMNGTGPMERGPDLRGPG